MRRGSTPIPDETKEKIFNMYQQGEWSQKHIAERFGVAHGSVTNIIQQYSKNRPQLDDIEKDEMLDIDKIQNGKKQSRLTSLEARIERIEDELGFV